MIIAAILFVIGILIGLSYHYLGIVVASLVLTLTVVPIWVLRGELGLFSIMIWMGYLFALQSGYLLGAYLRTDDGR